MAGSNWTFWLNMTNLALGVITVLALLLVGASVGWELLGKKRKVHETDAVDEDLWATLHSGPHILSVPGLGLTMGDGGEKVEPPDSTEEKPSRK